MEKNTKNASRMQTALNLVSDRVLPVVVNNFRNKLIGVVLAGLVLPQMAYAGHGGGGGGNKGGGGGRSGGVSAARSMSRPSSSNFQRSANSFKSSNAMKSLSQKNSNFQNGGSKQFAKKSFSQPIPAPNGNTGINGSGLPDRVKALPNGNTGFTGKGLPSTSKRRPFPTSGATGAGTTTPNLANKSFSKSLKANSGLNANASKISGNSGIKSLDKSKSWKQFRDQKVTKSDKGVLSNSGIKTRGDLDKVVTKNDKPSSPTGPIFDGQGKVVSPFDKVGIKTRGDFDKVVLGGGLGKKADPGTGGGGGKTDPGTGTGGGMGQGGGGQGGGMGGGGGKGQGNGKGGGKHGHHGFPWWVFVTPVVGYPNYPVYNSGYCEPVYQQPVYNNAPVYTNAPVVDQAPVTPVTYPASTQPAPATTPSQPVNVSTDGYVDLVLEDVEYLEPATVTVGPLYLVKVRNQGTKLSEKFRIGAFAQLEGELSDDAPRSVTEVPNLGAGETASVTLRLPAAAMKLISTSSAGSAAFNQLLVVVDLDDAVTEIEKSNNVANLDRAALEAAAAH